MIPGRARSRCAVCRPVYSSGERGRGSPHWRCLVRERTVTVDTLNPARRGNRERRNVVQCSKLRQTSIFVVCGHWYRKAYQPIPQPHKHKRRQTYRASSRALASASRSWTSLSLAACASRSAAARYSRASRRSPSLLSRRSAATLAAAVAAMSRTLPSRGDRRRHERHERTAERIELNSVLRRHVRPDDNG